MTKTAPHSYTAANEKLKFVFKEANEPMLEDDSYECELEPKMGYAIQVQRLDDVILFLPQFYDFREETEDLAKGYVRYLGDECRSLERAAEICEDHFRKGKT